MRSPKDLIEELLSFAGIHINGNQHYDIQVHNENFFRRVISEKELGLGESYMDGWWDAECLDEFIYKYFQLISTKK